MRSRLLLALMAALSLFLVFRGQLDEKQSIALSPGRKPELAQPAALKANKAPQAKKTAESASDDPMADFTEWTKDYLSTRKPDLISKGVKLAQERRPVFKEIIVSDPRRAIREAVRPLVRQNLPAEVLALLEKPVADHGVMRVYLAGPESVANGESAQLRYVETKGGETYQAHVFGRRAASVDWVPNLSAIGVEMDGQLALDERPLRVMEVGEIQIGRAHV